MYKIKHAETKKRAQRQNASHTAYPLGDQRFTTVLTQHADFALCHSYLTLTDNKTTKGHHNDNSNYRHFYVRRTLTFEPSACKNPRIVMTRKLTSALTSQSNDFIYTYIFFPELAFRM